MVLYISTDYRVLGIVCLNQLKGARHTHISYHDSYISFSKIEQENKFLT